MAYPDDRPTSREHRSRRSTPRDYDDVPDEDYYRRPKTYEPRSHGRSSRRNEYDGSDEDDATPPPRRHRSAKEKAPDEPDIPPPPIGEDRRGGHFKAGDDGIEVIPASRSGPADDDSYAPRKSKSSRRDPREDVETDPYASRRRKERNPYDEELPRRTSHRSRDDYDEPPRRSQGRDRDRDRDRYDDPGPPRRSKSTRSPRDEYELPQRSKSNHREKNEYNDYEPPRRSKPSRDAYEEPSRRKSTRDRRTAYPNDEDTEPEYAPPRRRREEKPARYDDGYGTDRPKRQPRDDYDRGYRTDGRDPRRERRHEPRDPRDAPRRDDRHRYDDYDDYDGRKPRSKKKGGPNFNGMLEKGKKNWDTVAPVAKPLITTLANAYLKNGRPA